MRKSSFFLDLEEVKQAKDELYNFKTAEWSKIEEFTKQLGITSGLKVYCVQRGHTTTASLWNYDPRPIPEDIDAGRYIIVTDSDRPYQFLETSEQIEPTRLSILYFEILNRTVRNEKVLRALVAFDFEGEIIPVIMSVPNAHRILGATLTEDLNMLVQDKTYPFDILKDILGNNKSIYRRGYYSDTNLFKFDYTVSSLLVVLQSSSIRGSSNIKTILTYLANNQDTYDIPKLKTSGISKLYNRIEPIAKTLVASNPLEFIAFRSLISESHRTIDGVKMSAMINEVFANVATGQDIVDIIKPITNLQLSPSERPYYYRYNFDLNSLEPNLDFIQFFERAIRELPCYKDRRRVALKSKGERAFTKLLEEYDSLKLDETKFPLISNEIKESNIPITTFFSKKEQYFIINSNWQLWEEMLAKHRDITVSIANNASKRTTYEKDLMSYFYFILYTLPEYLEKHTGEKWTCLPRLVESASELEPPKADETGTVRQRSALTPIADNEAKTVTVPYASLAISGGYGTTYCYSHDYHVLNKGFSFKGNVVMSDIEEKLNGRDSYGLMFYTLTGSEQGRGYPTFLIIFERRQTGTHVHFHRTHPSRSKDGDYNPINDWIKVCYNWMVGNIHRDRIKYQQGDLVFISPAESVIDKLEFNAKVDAFDNHTFSSPVGFAPDIKKEKSNTLGYFKLDDNITLLHHEHEHVLMKAGIYELRQVRSWEANPQGVWSLRID